MNGNEYKRTESNKGMLVTMTEAHARKKLCPFALDDSSTCVVSDCMAWQEDLTLVKMGEQEVLCDPTSKGLVIDGDPPEGMLWMEKFSLSAVGDECGNSLFTVTYGAIMGWCMRLQGGRP